MIHIFQYSFKRFFRNKAELFWILLFPILLGTMFKMAFGGITESEQFQAIPVAIVYDDSEAAKVFRMVADELGKEGENQFLDITYCKDEKAKNLLDEINSHNEKINKIDEKNSKFSMAVELKINNSENKEVLKETKKRYIIIDNSLKNQEIAHKMLTKLLNEALASLKDKINLLKVL